MNVLTFCRGGILSITTDRQATAGYVDGKSHKPHDNNHCIFTPVEGLNSPAPSSHTCILISTLGWGRLHSAPYSGMHATVSIVSVSPALAVTYRYSSR